MICRARVAFLIACLTIAGCSLTERRETDQPTFNADFVPHPRDPLLEGDGPDDGFLGVTYTGFNPPDPELAVGPDHVLAITNGSISILSRNGDLLAASPFVGDGGFWTSVGAVGFAFDPEALWDHHHQRFWAMCCEREQSQSYFLLAVSNSDDPLGTWKKFRINVSHLGGPEIDSPNFAVTDDNVYLAADFDQQGDTFLVYIIPKNHVLAGDPDPPVSFVYIVGERGYALPQHVGEPSTRQYLVKSPVDETNSHIELYAIDDRGAGPTFIQYDLDVEPFAFPIDADQLGGNIKIKLFEPRFWSAAYVDGSLWAVHHVTPIGAKNTVVRWYEINMNGWPLSADAPELVQWGDINPGPHIFTIYPSIAANHAADAVITYARSSADETVSMWRAFRSHLDPHGQMQDPVLVKQSTSPQDSTRWGDYSKTQVDPLEPCVFWGHHEWTDDIEQWSTWIARLVNTHPADIDANCTLNILDFVAFQLLFQAGDLRADVNNDDVLDVLDFVAFQALFQS